MNVELRTILLAHTQQKSYESAHIRLYEDVQGPGMTSHQYECLRIAYIPRTS